MSVFAGLSVFVFIVPFSAILGGKLQNYWLSLMKFKDERMTILNEVFGGIKVIKFYGWEPSFMHRIRDVRNKEVNNLKKFAWMDSAFQMIFSLLPYLSLVISFTAYIFISKDNRLTAGKAFVTITYMNQLATNILILPLIIVHMVESSVALKRINDFMKNKELDVESIQHDENVHNIIEIENGNFAWEEGGSSILKEINLSIKPGSLIAIVGNVGSGKSSLLSSCLGEMVKISGSVNVVGNTAYVPQQAWYIFIIECFFKLSQVIFILGCCTLQS